ncbi:MAG: D-alanine--D-alanine ligase [Planctomycetes bacterium]|nr:D-alanine--D-alanine ligase [Planctomycetota bacterium]
MRVLILRDEVAADARADELDVLEQARVVRRALEELGHEALEIGFSLDLDDDAARIRALRPDVVFNLVESVARSGRLIHLAPALLDVIGVPYTGAGTEAMFVTSGKPLAKRMLRLDGVPTPDWCTAREHFTADGGPPRGVHIVKSAWEHGSLGLGDDSLVDAGARDLRAAIRDAAPALGGEAFAEAYVDGREFNIALLAGPRGPEVLPHAEIVFAGDWTGRARIVGYDAKWADGSFEAEGTPRRFDFGPDDDALLAELSALSLRCWRLFDLHGHARVDFRVGADGRPLVLEVNCNPCLSPDAGFAAALERARIPFARAVARVLDDVRR